MEKERKSRNPKSQTLTSIFQFQYVETIATEFHMKKRVHDRKTQNVETAIETNDRGVIPAFWLDILVRLPIIDLVNYIWLHVRGYI